MTPTLRPSLLLLAILAAGCAATAPAAPGANAATAAQLHEEQQRSVAQNLALFDDLDFNVFTNQRWGDLHKSHTQNVVVHWPDGHTTNGIDKHIEDLKAMFVWAPDTRIKVHPVKVGQADWTGVIGVMEGTFTQPMPVGDGKTIPPTARRTRSRCRPSLTGPRRARWTRSTSSGITRSS